MIKRVKQFFSIVFLASIFCTQTFAVNVVQRLFDAKDGLIDYTINDITFDDYGYVWLATQQGLYRVSSSATRRIDQPGSADALSYENIKSLIKVGNSHLLLKSDLSLTLYDISTNQFYNLLIDSVDSFDNDPITSHTTLANDNVMLLTESGRVMMFDSTSLQLEYGLVLDETLSWNSINRLQDNHFIYSSTNKIELRNAQGELQSSIDWNVKSTSLRGLFIDSKQNIWAYTNKGLYSVDISNQAISKVNIAPLNIRKLVEDKLGHLWMSTTSGLLSWQPDTQVIKSYKDELKRDSDIDYIDDIAIDEYGLIWVGGSGEGLALLALKPDFLLDYFNKASQYKLVNEMIWSVYAEDEKLWLGGDGGLNIVDKQTQESSLYLPDEFESSDSVYSLESLDSKHIVLATTNGLFVYDKTSNQEVDFSALASMSNGLRGKQLFTSYKDPHIDGRIWWGTFNEVHYWQPGLAQIEQFPLFKDEERHSRTSVSSVYRDRSNKLWVGGDKYLGYLDEQNNLVSLSDIIVSQYPNASINNILQVDENHLWLGTYQEGLLLLNLQSYAVSSVNHLWGVDCDTVYFVEKTAHYNLVGCENSLIRQDIKTEAIDIFSVNDGFTASEFNEAASFYVPNVGLYIGSPDGAMLVDVDKLEHRSRSQEISLESISVFYEAETELFLLADSFKMVRPDAKLISFQMTTFDYIDTAPINIKYRLVSSGSVNKPAYIQLDGQTQINIADLSAGNYTLELLHKKQGVWSTEPFQFQFSVSEYWWASKWFKALVLFSILFLAFSSVWLRQKQVRRVIGINTALRESEDKLRQSLRGSDSDLWEWDRGSNRIHFENQSGILGERRQFSYLIPDLPIIEDDRELVNQQWVGLLKGEQNSVDMEFRYYRGENNIGWLRIRGRVVSRDAESGQLNKVAGIYTEISEQRELQNEIDLLAKAFENTSEGMLILDHDKKIKVLNSAANTLLPSSQNQLIGASFESLIPSKNESEIIDDLLKNERSWNGELTFIGESEQYFPVWVNISVMLDKQGNTQHYVVVFSDITVRKQNELNLRHLANNDMLTGLENRSMFNSRLSVITQQAQQTNEKLALLFLDLDRFKHVNDSYGHSMGDALLVEAAKRLQRSVGDNHFVCRFGGDEFVILLRQADDVDQINAIAENILKEICAPFRLFGREFFVSTSIGISMWPEDTLDPETLIKNADLAMYHAKEEGRGNFQYYSAERNAEAQYHLRIESELRKALENNQLELFYQPQIDILQGDKFIGMEALIRWQHPQDGFIRPDIFIKVAESCGLIIDIDRWVLRQACLDGARWNELYDGPFQLSVNVSAVQFRQTDFIDSLKVILADTGMPPKCLAIEITEGVLMKELQIANSHLTQLKALGIEVAIDDFGTGYSSLAYLRNFEVNTLKIDRSFLIDIATNEADQAIVSSIIELARNLKLHVVAEGIESYEQMEQVFSRGCYIIQGYYFAKPMPRKKLDEFIGLTVNSDNKDNVGC
ncbi:EAL domain-containing protein [Shewanella sp. TC10]|uniref:EAL domain-containing protein n=1 Tax=Shewanella sp. TC10 TaxID=1419739 RepID=UPI00129D5D8F|nr:EAL domain-containing protein [Shewanella sp. TC10]